jgi:hypothetical protein
MAEALMAADVKPLPMHDGLQERLRGMDPALVLTVKWAWRSVGSIVELRVRREGSARDKGCRYALIGDARNARAAERCIEEAAMELLR